MIPYLEHQLRNATPETQRSIVREYLQMRILQSLQRAGAMIPLAFHGGTALRFLFQIGRYSEDLDFALERQVTQYDFQAYLSIIQRDLTADAYSVEIKFNDRKMVHSSFIRFRGLLHQLDISPHHDEIIAIKIDTNPPAGAVLATTLVQHHVDVNIQHHDGASLLAGKLHAILQREYVKGRDWYDLYWYLRQPQWSSPNIRMLNQALVQSNWTKGDLTEHNWHRYVLDRLELLDWQRVVHDVRPFVIYQEELLDFKKEVVQELLTQNKPPHAKS